MLRGTRIIDGEDAVKFSRLVDDLRKSALGYGLSEVIVPSIAPVSLFDGKVGS